MMEKSLWLCSGGTCSNFTVEHQVKLFMGAVSLKTLFRTCPEKRARLLGAARC